MANKVVTKGGKPFQSKLAPYEKEIMSLSQQGMSVRSIASLAASRYGVNISHNAVASFIRTHRPKRRNFLDGISVTRQTELLKAIKALWTHGSTGIEGNTLSLGDTMAVLEYGLTVKGKPLKDHQDVVSHAKGVDFISSLLDKSQISADDLFTLHRIIMSAATEDIYRPVGAWKREDNGTYGAEGGKSVYMSYALSEDTPELMDKWIKYFNSLVKFVKDEETALEAYLSAHVSFVRIHPFFDGNGRLARALTEYMLAKGERSPMRFYSLSSQIQKEKESYYEELQRAQRGTLDATRWVKWFLECHKRAVLTAEERLSSIFAKADFWQRHSGDGFNANQRMILNRLFDGFEGNLTSSKWAKMCKVSQDTASREINALVSIGVLVQQGQGRSTHYVMGS